MVPAGSLVWIVLGAALVGVGSQVTIPSFTWVALILLLHASRSASAWRAAPWIFLGFYVAVLVGNRGILPVSGPAYFAIGGFFALTATTPFVLDRLAPLGSG